MKKHLSIFMLIVRYSLYPVLGILAAMVLVQVGMFYFLGAGKAAVFSDALAEIPTMPVACAALVLLSVMLCRALCDKDGRMNNLVLRLGVLEKVIFLWQGVYNCMVFMLFFLTEALTLLLLAFLYETANPGAVTSLELLFSVYHYPMFNTFFPMENGLNWFAAIVMILCLGFCCAAYPTRQRHRKTSLCTWLMVLTAAAYLFLQEVGWSYLGGENLIFVIPAAVIFLGFSWGGVVTMEVDDDGKA